MDERRGVAQILNRLKGEVDTGVASSAEFKTKVLTADSKEPWWPTSANIVILRIAVLNDAPYEWDSHERPGRRAGLDDQHLSGHPG